MKAVRRKIFRHVFIHGKGRCCIDMCLRPYPAVHFVKFRFPVFCRRLPVVFPNPIRGDWRNGKQDRLDVVSPAFFLKSFQVKNDLFRRSPAALFGPEHGVRGDHDAGATVETYTDPATRLPVYSLYRKDSQHMTPEMLDLVDTVIYDIQDIGARFYTYISTLLYVMRDCAAAGKELVVLDRINPLGGKVEGGLLQPGFESFVGAYPLTTRYGLTPGEFARLANEEQHIGCQLHVLPVLGWKREMLFPETGLYWMMPSPAIPNFETALLYPGTCLTEATNISEGRGTSAPFELIGAPFINGAALADRMNAKKLPGVIFTAAYFTPSASKHAGRRCEGVHIHLTDTKAYDTIRTGTALLYAIREIYPNDFALRQPEDEKALLPINRLTGSDVLAHDWPDFDALMERWENEAKAFDERAAFARMYE